MHEYYHKHMHGTSEAFTSSIKESLDAMRSDSKTLFFAQAMNIIGDTDDFESIIMEDTIWSQGRILISIDKILTEGTIWCIYEYVRGQFRDQYELAL